MLINVITIVAMCITVYMLLLTVSNIIFFRVATKKPGSETDFASIKVSVLIPARNEEQNIAKCLNSFVNQSHKNYEVIVLDDNSTDQTFEIAESFKDAIPQLRVLHGLPLEAGWNGKQYASHQLASASTGDVLIFADADTTQSKDSILFGLTNLRAHKADLLSGYPHQHMCSYGEMSVIPLLFLLMSLVQPFYYLKKSRHGFAAIGQFIMVTREVYFSVGGFAAIRNLINDDLHFAGLVKKKGYIGIFLDLKEHVFVRMYTGFKSSFDGITKNIFSALNNSILVSLLIPLFAVVTTYVPIGAFVYSLVAGSVDMLALVQIVLMLSVSACITIDRKLPLITVLYPVTYTMLGVVGINSAILAKSKRGFVWRGRVVIEK